MFFQWIQKKYYWESPDYNEEEDDFLRHFDEEGNFIEFLPEEVLPDQESIQDENPIQIIYNYNESAKNSSEEE